MGSSVVVRATGLSKIYPLDMNPLSRMRALLLTGQLGEGGFRALHDVSLKLSRGEALGIVGRNGAGKSTLLQILCGTQTPTSGTVERFGRIAAMLELGAGFNPEFTGRENVYLNASIHGLSDAEIAARFDRIAGFADIGDFIDRPVQEYSSGMHARLAFAICAHVDADVLVVDEVLGVGDHAFQAKCGAFIENFLKTGAVIVVSHDENAVLSICDRAIWLEHGDMKANGPADDVLRQYRQAMEMGESIAPVADVLAPVSATLPDETPDPRAGSNPIAVSAFRAHSPSHGHGGAVIEDAYLADEAGPRLDRVQGGSSVSLHITGRALEAIARPIVGFIFRDGLGQNLFGDNTYLAYKDRPKPLGAGERFHGVLTFRLPFLPPGAYSLAPSIIEGTQQSHVQLYWIEEALILTVIESPVTVGKIGVPMRFRATVRRARGG